MEKIIFEIERQIQRLQAAKQLLIDTQDSSTLGDSVLSRVTDLGIPPVKRGRGRPRKHPLPPTTPSPAEQAAA